MHIPGFNLLFVLNKTYLKLYVIISLHFYPQLLIYLMKV